MKVAISDNAKFLIKDESKDFHSKFGYLKCSEFKSKKVVKTNKGKEFFILPAQFIDAYEKIKRGAQIISLKDIGAIITETGIDGNSRVLDAGAGSGALTCYLAHIVKEVFSYEIREDFAKITHGNIDYLGLKNVKLKVGDITKGIKESKLDLITLDLKNPEEVVEHAEKALKRGGFLVFYTPQVIQALIAVNKAIDSGKFVYSKTKELGEREWKVKGRIAKPIEPLLSHTGFLTFLRRV